MATTALDLNGLTPELLKTLEFSRPESEAETRARITRGYVELGREVVISLAAIVLIGIIVYMALSTISNQSATVDDKKWATSIITTLAGALVGYLTGRASK